MVAITAAPPATTFSRPFHSLLTPVSRRSATLAFIHHGGEGGTMQNGHAIRSTALELAPLSFPARGTPSLAELCPDWRGPSLAVHAGTLDLLHANAPARDLLDRRMPVALLGNRLILHTPAQTRRLAEAMYALLDGDTDAATLVVDDPQAAATFALRLNLTDWSGHDAPLAVVEVTDASLAPHPPLLDAIATAFGLTSAEGRVLGLLAAGLSLRDIAGHRGVQIETVRHQCKAVLGKMRCRRQSDLVRLVAVLARSSAAG